MSTSPLSVRVDIAGVEESGGGDAVDNTIGVDVDAVAVAENDDEMTDAAPPEQQQQFAVTSRYGKVRVRQRPGVEGNDKMADDDDDDVPVDSTELIDDDVERGADPTPTKKGPGTGSGIAGVGSGESPVDVVTRLLDSTTPSTPSTSLSADLAEQLEALSLKENIKVVHQQPVTVTSGDGCVIAVHGEYVVIRARKSKKLMVKRLVVDDVSGDVSAELVCGELPQSPVVHIDAIPFVSFVDEVDDVTGDNDVYMLVVTRDLKSKTAGESFVWNLNGGYLVSYKMLVVGGETELDIDHVGKSYGAVPPEYEVKPEYGPDGPQRCLVVASTAVLTKNWAVVVCEVGLRGVGTSVVLAYNWRDVSEARTTVVPDRALVRFGSTLTGIVQSAVDRECDTLIWFSTSAGPATLNVALPPAAWAVLPANSVRSHLIDHKSNSGEPLSDYDEHRCARYASSITGFVADGGVDIAGFEVVRTIRSMPITGLEHPHTFTTTGRHDELISVSVSGPGSVIYIDRDTRTAYVWELGGILSVLVLANGRGFAVYDNQASVALFEKPSPAGPPAHTGTFLHKNLDPETDDKMSVTSGVVPSNNLMTELATINETTVLVVCHSYEHVVYPLAMTVKKTTG